MSDAIYLRKRSEFQKNAAATIGSGELQQMRNGLAGIYTGLRGAVSGDPTNWTTKGQFTVTKTSGVVFLDGQEVYWDHSANALAYRKVNDRDFFAGTVVGDAASLATTCVLNLNQKAERLIDVARDPFLTTIVGTQALGGLALLRRGGSHSFVSDTSNEAQKIDILSVDGFAPGAKWIVEGEFRVVNDGAGTVHDVSIGVASGTHASDADTIAESAFIHLDGNNTNINAECDDGTNETAATDTLADYTEGSAVANRVFFQIDGRDTASLKFYVNGVRVLAGTTFNMSAAVGPLFALAHCEKSANAAVYEIAIDSLRVRTAEA